MLKYITSECYCSAEPKTANDCAHEYNNIITGTSNGFGIFRQLGISHSFALLKGKLKKRHQRLFTTKNEKELHGIGMEGTSYNLKINGTKSMHKSQVITLSLSNYYKNPHNTPFYDKLVPKGGQSQ